MGHFPGHDRDPLAVQALPFHLIPLGEARVQMLSPFFWSQFWCIKRKVSICPNPLASATARRVITAEMGQFA